MAAALPTPGLKKGALCGGPPTCWGVAGAGPPVWADECGLSAAPRAPRPGGGGRRQEALGVDRACGNDFIGKACDIFSPLVCGSWRRLEVYLVGTAGGSRAAAHIWTCRPVPRGPCPAAPLAAPASV